jgi:hypothetical protein
MEPHSSEADAFALAMIVFMVFGMGIVGMILFTVFRNAAKKNREVDDLIDEVARKEGKQKTPAAPVSKEWEKDADWWKK